MRRLLLAWQKDLARVTVDTTVQSKNISFPTDSKLPHAAIRGLNCMAQKHGVRLRQSYLRSAKRATMMAGRYAHAKQFKRHQRELRRLRTRLGRIIRDIRAYVDKGCGGHDAPNAHRVFMSGQKRGVFGVIKRELRRCFAIEPAIGHIKAEGHLGPCYLKGSAGDAANAILSAIGYNLRRVLAWLKVLLSLYIHALCRAFAVKPALNPAF